MKHRDKSIKTIALFGGSFNPPHEGHREIARRVARRSRIDEVWILPIFRHAFEKKTAPFSKRFKMSRLYFKNVHPKIKVKDLEKRLGGVSYTARLIRYLRQKHPQWKLYWVMGADTFRDRKKWKDFNYIKKEAELIVFKRGPRSPIPNVSSTAMRLRA